MELAKSELDLSKPKNWGEITYQNLKRREHERETAGSINITKKETVREALEAYPLISGPLDGSDIIQRLSQDEQCDFFTNYPHCESLMLRSWEKISNNTLRCISISFATSLLELDLSYSAAGTAQLEILLVQATNLSVLKLNNCPNIDTNCALLIVKLVNKTLKEFSANSCIFFKQEPLLVIGGQSGFTKQSLSKLKSLDLGNNPVVDRGLIAISTGCKKLCFLNLENCFEITDASMLSIAKFCTKLMVLNVSGCAKLTNKSISAVGRNCPEIISLNLSRCPLVSDKGIKFIALGCKNLQAVNLAGLLKITEDSMFILADSCPGLLTMNLTGCERITVNGLNALVSGLQYVEKGITFMGFKPIDAHVDRKLNDYTTLIRESTGKMRRRAAAEKAQHEEDMAAELNLKLNTAAAKIQNYMYRYKLRLHFYRLWVKRVKNESAVAVQRIYRGKKGRRVAGLLKAQRDLFISAAPSALLIQKTVRAYLCRLGNKHVSKTVREMYIIRRLEAESALAVRIQSIGRRFLAKLRVEAWKELRKRRDLDSFNAILILQMMVRRYFSRKLLRKKRRDKKNYDEARKNASDKIRNFCAVMFKRYKGRLSGEALRLFYREKWVKATTIQRVYRGFKGSEHAQKLRIQLATKHYAAREIQRVFRGTRVLHWRDLRLNVIAAFVFDRHYAERRGAIDTARARYKQFVLDNQCDSASEPDDDDAMEEEWAKFHDTTRRVDYWQNFTTNEITYDEPPNPLAHEYNLIHKRIQVFWVVQGQWYEGTITRYNKRKKRHRVEYDDGDHEWINLLEECERVQIQLDNGTWTMYIMYQSEALIYEWQKVEEKRSREQFKSNAFQDALQWKMFIDDHTQQIMFLSQKSGVVRTGVPDADKWVVQDDGLGYPCFYNMDNSQIVYEDPRFIIDEDQDLAAQRKYVMQELRFAMYFCKELWDNYNKAESVKDPKQLELAIVAIRNSSKVIHLNSFLIRAKALYQPQSVVDKNVDTLAHEEITYCTWIAERLAEIVDSAEEIIIKRKNQKETLLINLSKDVGKPVYCPHCKRETKKHLDFCPSCGKRQVF